MYLVIDDHKKVRIERENDENEINKRIHQLVKQGKTIHVCYDITSVNEVIQDIERSQENG